MDFITNNWLEIFGVCSSLTYLYFSVNRKSWLWLMGILSSTIYAVVFYRNALYAETIINSYYVIISVYGWFKWVSAKGEYHEETHQVDVLRVNRKEVLKLTILGIIIFIVIYFSIKTIPELLNIKTASVAFFGTFLTALSFVATWMLTKRYIEQWFLWMFINGSYIFICTYKGLYFTVILNVIYTFVSVVGYIKWSKSKNSQNIKERA